MAARRQRPDRAGHDAPEHGIIPPAPARSCPRPQFHFLAPSPSVAPAAPLSAIVAERLAVTQLARRRVSTTSI